jgi:hypothetical protein
MFTSKYFGFPLSVVSPLMLHIRSFIILGMNNEVKVLTGMESPHRRNNNTQCLYLSMECTFPLSLLENYKPKCPKTSDHKHASKHIRTATLLIETVSPVLWISVSFVFHAALMFMSNGFEIQLDTARSSTSLQIRMTGSNTSSNQEINTTLCYIRWSRYISVYKLTSRTAVVRFPLRVRFFSV